MFDCNTMAAQRELWQLQGQRRTWFCGAYFGYGFHEDGLKSGLRVAADFQANVVSVLRAQTHRKIDRIDYAAVAQSSVAIQERMAELRLIEVELAVADAATTDDFSLATRVEPSGEPGRFLFEVPDGRLVEGTALVGGHEPDHPLGQVEQALGLLGRIVGDAVVGLGHAGHASGWGNRRRIARPEPV